MPDKVPENVSRLSEAGINEHWVQVSGVLARLVALMNSREPWVIPPDDEFLELLDNLVERVADAEFAQTLDKGENASRVAEVFAVLSSSRFLRVAEIFERQQPGVLSRLIFSMAQLGGDAEVFVRLLHERLLTIHRTELLEQVFSAERSRRIIEDIQLIREMYS